MSVLWREDTSVKQTHRDMSGENKKNIIQSFYKTYSITTNMHLSQLCDIPKKITHLTHIITTLLQQKKNSQMMTRVGSNNQLANHISANDLPQYVLEPTQITLLAPEASALDRYNFVSYRILSASVDCSADVPRPSCLLVVYVCMTKLRELFITCSSTLVRYPENFEGGRA